MYALYETTFESGGCRYRFVKRVSLFGCKVGYIPCLLGANLSSNAHEPFTWHVKIRDGLRRSGLRDNTLVINLKPNSASPNLSLYELVNVWGYSNCGWTPIMLHIRGLFIDEDPKAVDGKEFFRGSGDIDDPIFSMMYLNGTIKDGVLQGRWTPPRASPTNAVLLWPDVFEFFARQAHVVRQAVR